MMSTLTSQRITLAGMKTGTRASRWRFVLVGGIDAGKTTLLRVLEDKAPTAARKTQMVDDSGWGIDTPGEFSAIRRYRRYISTVFVDAQVIVAVQDATRATSFFPPRYFETFPQQTIGVVTKLDLPGADAERGARLLREAGVTGEIYTVSAITGQGISKLRDDLLNQTFSHSSL